MVADSFISDMERQLGLSLKARLARFDLIMDQMYLC